MTSKVSILTEERAAGISAFLRECSMKVQYSEANHLIIILLLDEKCLDIYSYAFYKVGILVWVESDHVRRDRQGTCKHFPSQGGNAPKQSYCIMPSTAKTLCGPVSHRDFCFDKSWHLFCFSFPPRHDLPFSTLSFPAQPLFFLRCQKYVH